MKKSFKRAGVAVLSMAMLLSMGAVGAMTANASDYAITVQAKTDSNNNTGLKTGDKVKVFKVATSDASGWSWTTEFAGTAGLPASFDASDFSATNVKAVAAALARTANAITDTTKFTSGTVGSPIDVGEAGYYLVVAAPNDAGLVAAPMLVELTQTEKTKSISEIKVSAITLTKKITNVAEGATNKAGNVQTTGKNAMAKAGDVVSYRIESLIPTYDSSATSIQNFVLTDKSDNTLTSCDASGFNVFIADTVSATTGTDVKKYLTRTDDQKFTVSIPGINASTDTDLDVQSNGGKYLIVEFTATVGDNPTLSKNLGVRENQRDAAKGEDANKNDVTLTYGNNYSTGGGSDTDGDGDVDEHDDQPELKDYADVYVTALGITKTLGEVAVTETGKVSFGLFDSTGNTPIKSFTEESAGKFSLKGLDAGTYMIKETNTPPGYVAADPITVTITADSTTKATFSASSTGRSWSALSSTNDVMRTTVDNPKLGALPGTGGMGTVLFTVGGAAIVLLAGALFVVYLRKRKTEE